MEVRRKQRWKAACATLLALGLLVQSVRLAQRHLGQRHDFSEDQLFAISPGTQAILGRLEDRLQVKAFVTADVRSGEMALIKARVEAQLKELQRLSQGRMGITFQDPSVLSAAASEAQSFGIDPLPVSTTKGGEQNLQLVSLGAVLRYRSRTEVLPWLNPWSLEVDFASAVQRLLQDEKLRLGWCGVPLAQEQAPIEYGQFLGLRERLKRRMDVVEVPVAALEAGSSIPEDLDLLLVLRPQDWHPRAVFALDQFVQRGGRVLIAFDLVASSPWGTALHATQGSEQKPSGLEALLRAWGAPLEVAHVWDTERPGIRRVIVQDLDENGQPTQQGRLDPVPDPACPMLPAAAFERTFPATARSEGVQFFWAHGFRAATPPPGVTRLDVVHSSPASYWIDLIEQTKGSVNQIEGQTRAFLASGKGQSIPLAVVLSGRFATPFEKGAPAPFDATRDERGGKVATTEETVIEGQADAQVVLVGDSDWLRDPLPGDYAPILPSASAPNLALFDNWIDWLSQEEDLIAVRSKEPRDRPLRNFQEEERRAEGLYGPDTSRTSAEMRARLERLDQADRRAARKRWLVMLWPVLSALALVFLAGGFWNWKERSSA